MDRLMKALAERRMVTPLQQIGEKVHVYYLPGTPEVNCLGDPQRLYSAELPVVFLASMVFSSMIVGVLAFRLAGRSALRR
jgi:hypothetical protein